MQNTIFNTVASLIMTLALIAPAQAKTPALKKVGDCQANSFASFKQDLSNAVEIKSVEQFPKKIFIARSADYFVEVKQNGIRLWSHQSFISGEDRAMCASFQEKTDFDSALNAPVLMDFSPGQEVGDSFWQFRQMISGDNKVGIWNQRILLSLPGKNILARLENDEVRVFMQMLTPSLYQLHFLREGADSLEHLVIRYDIIDGI
jgi:hypothetical protein